MVNKCLLGWSIGLVHKLLKLFVIPVVKNGIDTHILKFSLLDFRWNEKFIVKLDFYNFIVVQIFKNNGVKKCSIIILDF